MTQSIVHLHLYSLTWKWNMVHGSFSHVNLRGAFIYPVIQSLK